MYVRAEAGIVERILTSRLTKRAWPDVFIGGKSSKSSYIVRGIQPHGGLDEPMWTYSRISDLTG
jgi:hypothetical protein